jgi:hypothetical protein
VLAAAAQPPVTYYSFFVKSLLETVRINIADCAASAYSHLSLNAATKILMFNTTQVRSSSSLIPIFHWDFSTGDIGIRPRFLS